MFIKTNRILTEKSIEDIKKHLGKENIIVIGPDITITNIDPAVIEIIENKKEDIYSVEISKDGDIQIYFERSDR